MNADHLNSLLTRKFAEWVEEEGGQVVALEGNQIFCRVAETPDARTTHHYEYVIDINVVNMKGRIAPFDGELWLEQVGDKKIQVIKEVRAVASMSLIDAKNLVDHCGSPYLGKTQPQLVATGLTYELWDDHATRLEAAGAKVRRLPLEPIDPFTIRLTQNRLRRFERELS